MSSHRLRRTLARGRRHRIFDANGAVRSWGAARAPNADPRLDLDESRAADVGAPGRVGRVRRRPLHRVERHLDVLEHRAAATMATPPAARARLVYRSATPDDVGAAVRHRGQPQSPQAVEAQAGNRARKQTGNRARKQARQQAGNGHQEFAGRSNQRRSLAAPCPTHDRTRRRVISCPIASHTA